MRAVFFLLFSSSMVFAQEETPKPAQPPVFKPKYDFTIHRNVVYAKRGELELKSAIYVPKGEGPFPGVLMVHGGAWSTGSRGHMHHDAVVIAGQGYTVMSINYRLAPKYKHPAQIEDCRAAVRWFRDQATTYKLDPHRLAAYGYSAGGHLVGLLGTLDDTETGTSSKVQAVIAGGAPCEFRVIPKTSKTFVFVLGKTREEAPEIYAEFSPPFHADKDDAPTFFFHGENDTLVPMHSARALETALKKVDVETVFFVVPQAGHIAAMFSQLHLHATFEFLEKHLGE